MNVHNEFVQCIVFLQKRNVTNVHQLNNYIVNETFSRVSDSLFFSLAKIHFHQSTDDFDAHYRWSILTNIQFTFLVLFMFDLIDHWSNPTIHDKWIILTNTLFKFSSLFSRKFFSDVQNRNWDQKWIFGKKCLFNFLVLFEIKWSNYSNRW